jgi:hypothetical protein
MTYSDEHDFSIVAVDKFIQATRDSGYTGTSSAVAELIDNSLQAGATNIDLSIRATPDETRYPLALTVVDNGSGMDQRTLRTALRFGGSTRFNRRDGLGRYGMGLPNSSFSQAQRVTVHTWQSGHGPVLCAYLDLDEIAIGQQKTVPIPLNVSRPSFVNGYPSGTAVTWSRCDRLDNSRISTLVRKLLLSLGRRFRHFIWEGVRITVNGDQVQAVDPLFLHTESMFCGATEHSSFEREIAVSAEDPSATGIVRVRFSELPVADWSRLNNQEKRERGIAKGAGVSIVRGGREVDYGWYFLGGKRRENYDDWWRCEIQFDPVLDEAFGITHTKQQIRPRPQLVEALGADIENTARALNTRARKAHFGVKIAERFSSSEDRATEKDGLLTPLPSQARARDVVVLDSVRKELSQCSQTGREPEVGVEYRIVPKALSDTCFFNYARAEGKLVLVLNPDHPFYKLVYKALLESEDQKDISTRISLDLLLLAAARAEALLDGKDELKVAEQLRSNWSDTLATFLNR